MPWTAVNSEGYPAPAALAVDTAVLTVRDGELIALAIRRDDGALALPGGFVGAGERPDETARRKLREKTGLRRDLRRAAGRLRRPRTRPARLDPLDRLPRARPARHRADRRERALDPRPRPAPARLRPSRDPARAPSSASRASCGGRTSRSASFPARSR